MSRILTKLWRHESLEFSADTIIFPNAEANDAFLSAELSSFAILRWLFPGVLISIGGSPFFISDWSILRTDETRWETSYVANAACQSNQRHCSYHVNIRYKNSSKLEAFQMKISRYHHLLHHHHRFLCHHLHHHILINTLSPSTDDLLEMILDSMPIEAVAPIKSVKTRQ